MSKPVQNSRSEKVSFADQNLLKYLCGEHDSCLLYTSDAADDLRCVGLGGRRLIKKKKYTATH